MTKHFAVPSSVMAVLAVGAPEFAFIFADGEDDTIVMGHRARQVEITEASTSILNRAEAEKRDLTEAEQKEVDGLTDEFDGLERQINIRVRVAAMSSRLSAPRGRLTEPDPAEDDPQNPNNPGLRNSGPQRPAPRVPATVITARGTGGFHNFGDFALAVRRASFKENPQVDARLQNAALSTYGNEGTGADGGFTVPPDYRSEILTKAFGEDSLIARTDQLRTAGNSITLPTDETTPWDSSGGIQAYWVGEAGTKTQSKPIFGETSIKLHTLAVLVPVTEELLEDSPAMGSYLGRKAPEKIDFKVSNAIVRGTGAGMPLGFLNSPSLVTVSKESGQAADTINATNAVKMLGRLPTASRATAAWLIHPDAEVQLPLMTIGQQPVYLPPGGLRDAPFGSLLGRPVIPHQVAETVGDLGDIMLVDLQQYLTAVKTGNGRDANGIKQDVSIHLWFDQDAVAFRFTLRVAGAPWWAAPITQRDGSNTQSPFVVLEAR